MINVSSDAAHSPRSIFQVVHETITKNPTIIIQIHGFTLTKNPGYPQIVLSLGDGASTSPVSELSSILWAKNFTAMIANGGTLKELEATTNVQGKYTNSIGATFIHIELESSVREDPSEYGKVIAAINEFCLQVCKRARSREISKSAKAGATVLYNRIPGNDRCTHSAVIDTAPNLMTYQF